MVICGQGESIQRGTASRVPACLTLLTDIRLTGSFCFVSAVRLLGTGMPFAAVAGIADDCLAIGNASDSWAQFW